MGCDLNIAIWEGSVEYDLQYCLLELFHGVLLKLLSSVGLWNTAIVNFLVAPTYIQVWYVLFLFCISS